jgi:hypothetical protein
MYAVYVCVGSWGGKDLTQWSHINTNQPATPKHSLPACHPAYPWITTDTLIMNGQFFTSFVFIYISDVHLLSGAHHHRCWISLLLVASIKEYMDYPTVDIQISGVIIFVNYLHMELTGGKF